MTNYTLLIIAIALDLLIGDPVTPVHPVRLIGSLIKRIESIFYNSKLTKRLSGFIGVILSLTIVLVLFLTLYFSSSLIPYGKEIFSIFIFYSTIAIKDLAAHGLRVKKALDKEEILLARKYAGMMLSRDIENLSTNEIIAGTVESISENLSDSIVAPIFWGLILGPAGALAYRVINTLDAMWGYKNERYTDFGRTAALLDDVVNFLPARLTGILICLASGLNAGNPFTTIRIMFRDHKNTVSPNAGYPEAAMAGALGIQLGGDASYFGKMIDKHTIGDKRKEAEAGDISKSIKIIAKIIFLFLFITGIIKLI